ncbi:sortase family protein [Catenulispora acidiphila DSM 44928]|uniref:Sortase family protein n=1 Tax=Catenulispora acidiphila (strain DSM 44928 / JCM 14897 / NBRC 102108 / NRRL B-24433 / ID139908) TaxID=479433 RepID=C7Q2A2_CATAD|nr:class E sortase [Catenulispora acidiphila]ACU77639.1 sortase family protein [Catenulispora acidiphila DSM 44928]
MARAGALLRIAIRTVGELLVTSSVLLALFIVYQLYYTNVVGRHVMNQEVNDIHKQWTVAAPARPSAPVVMAAPPPAPMPHNGDDVAILHIPRLGSGLDDAGIPVLEGVGLDILNKATGHYPGTALPGQIGNFSVAGHRKTHGEPFRHLDEMRAGDLVYVETAKDWYTYRIDADPVIVQPTDLGVVDPVPGEPGVRPTQDLMTLTTCNPWWSSTQRMIVTGHLIATRPRT